jgi:hypothetical protein
VDTLWTPTYTYTYTYTRRRGCESTKTSVRRCPVSASIPSYGLCDRGRRCPLVMANVLEVPPDAFA